MGSGWVLSLDISPSCPTTTRPTWYASRGASGRPREVVSVRSTRSQGRRPSWRPCRSPRQVSSWRPARSQRRCPLGRSWLMVRGYIWPPTLIRPIVSRERGAIWIMLVPIRPIRMRGVWPVTRNIGIVGIGSETIAPVHRSIIIPRGTRISGIRIRRTRISGVNITPRNYS